MPSSDPQHCIVAWNGPNPFEKESGVPNALHADDPFPVHGQDRVIGMGVRDLRRLVAGELLVLCEPLSRQRRHYLGEKRGKLPF